MKNSVLQEERYNYRPTLPSVFKENVSNIRIKNGEATESISNQTELKQLFPGTYGNPLVSIIKGENKDTSKEINIGVVLSGGQAPGGHNVIAGLFDAVKNGNKKSKLFGFIGGPSGILDNQIIEITSKHMDQYRNTGGFDIIGSGRTKIESEEQFVRCFQVCMEREISALVIIGGDDSNTNAAILAEYFLEKETGIKVIGVPKTIDGDLKTDEIEISFGFDTATKTYSELIGNIERDADSAKKYWHFIKLMGRSASHICLECALQTQPNIAIISEEVEDKQRTLNQIVEDIANIIVKRSDNGENFGIVLVPEGLIEFIPEMKSLIIELNNLLAENEEYFNTLRTFENQSEWINKKLSKDSSYVFSSLPNNIQRQLLMDRDPHGNVQVSRIETEILLIRMVKSLLNELKNKGEYNGEFSSQHHFLGYEGRAAFPSNFDANYTYSLGYNAFILIASGLTGYMSSIKNLSAPSEEWVAGGVPITKMMTLEQRHGKMKPVIEKALVKLDKKPFRKFAGSRDEFAIKTSYISPGAIQYFGPDKICNQPTKTLLLEQE